MAVTRNALGRGLGALLPSSSTPGTPAPVPVVTPEDSGPGSTEIAVASIDTNPEQPRRHFDPGHLEQLAASIRRHGVLQPVVVRRAGERFELVVGERRYRASQAAGLETIPAVIADIAPAARLEVALVENIQRQDLNPIELAQAYRALADAGHTQDEIGERVGLDRSSVANHMRLLELARSIQADVEEGRLSMGHAKALLQVSNPERRRHLRHRIVEGRLSVREAERIARDSGGPARHRRSEGAGETAKGSPAGNHEALAEALEKQLLARVRIHGDDEKGRIEIQYSSVEDLTRIGRAILEGV